MTKIRWCVAVALSLGLVACGGCAGVDPAEQTKTPGPPPLPPAPPPPPPTAPCDNVQSSALTTALQARAGDEAKGSKAEGPPICGVVAEGFEVLSAPIMLEQGQCYTALAEGLPPVAELDMQLRLDMTTTGMPLVPQLGLLGQQPLMVNTMPGLHGGMGQKQSCYLWSFPSTPARLVVKAKKGGAGPVAAQLYKRKK